jgi:hypothetical protein
MIVSYCLKSKLGTIAICEDEVKILNTIKCGNKLHQNDNYWTILKIERWHYFLDDGRTHDNVGLLIRQEIGSPQDPLPGKIQLVQ